MEITRANIRFRVRSLEAANTNMLTTIREDANKKTTVSIGLLSM